MSVLSTGFLCVNGIPLSTARTLAYARNGYSAGLTWGDCGCPGWNEVDNLGQPYADPTTDDMPWVTPAEPESADWAGLVITDIQGLDGTPVFRDVTERVGDGASFSRSRKPGQEITITAISVGRTCQAAWWGYRWLNETLAGGSCGSGCDGMDLTYFLTCPDPKGSCLLPTSPEGLISELAAKERRHKWNVQLTNGIYVEDRLRVRCQCAGSCTFPIIQFSLTAGDPYAYADPVTVFEDQPLSPCLDGGTCPEWLVVADGEEPPQDCPISPSCQEDDVCGVVPSPPDLPIVVDPCACDPLTFSTTCFDVPSSDLFNSGSTVPAFCITAGSTDIRGLTVTFIPNPSGVDPDDADACNACFEVSLGYLPANSTWTFDGMTRTTTIDCFSCTSVDAKVSGPEGGPVEWPEFDCVQPYVMCVSADCLTDVSEVTVSLQTVGKQG